MDYSDEFNRILQSCKECSYVAENAEYLRSFFQDSGNLSMLKHSLTTKRNFVALTIMEKLCIRVVPLLIINEYTYASVYCLHRSGVIPKADFENMKRRFEIIENAKRLFEDTERNYLAKRMEKYRRSRSSRSIAKSSTRIYDTHYVLCTCAAFAIDIDELLKIEDIIGKLPLLPCVFKDFDASHISTLSLEEDDAESMENRSFHRSIAQYFRTRPNGPAVVLDRVQQRSVNILAYSIRKLAFLNAPYILITRQDPGTVLFLLFSLITRFPLCSILKLSSPTEETVLGLLPSGMRRLFFSSCGNVPCKFLEITVRNFSRASQENTGR